MPTTGVEPETATDDPGAPIARAINWAYVAEGAVLVLCTLFVMAGLAPGHVLNPNLPVGTDVTGHSVGVWAVLRQPSLLLPGGWSDAMFAGYPADQLYPSLANGVGALVASVTSVGAGTKLTLVLPIIALPLCAWSAGRLSGLGAVVSLGMAAAMCPWVFDPSCVICGGNIASTVNGEYAYAWGIALSLVAVGLVDRFLRTGRLAAVTSIVVALALLAHPATALWLVVLIGVLLVVHIRTWRGHAHTVVLVAIAAVALAVPWWLPFVARREWMPQLTFPKRDDYLFWLFPAAPVTEIVIMAFAVAGVVWAVRRRSAVLLAIIVAALLALISFIAIPDGAQLFNLRVLPFWLIGRWLLAGVGLVVVVREVARRLSLARPDLVAGSAVVLALVAAFAVVGTTWGWWAVAPQAAGDPGRRSQILGLEINPVSDGADRVLGGAELRSDAAELASVQDLLRRTGTRLGCGRLAWDLGSTAGGDMPFGDNQIWWQAPVWTEGCLKAATGVYVDSSATAPAMVGMESLVSRGVGVSIPGIQQYEPNLSTGVARMRTMGIKYFLSQGAAPKPGEGLTQVGRAGSWTLWQVENAATVLDLTNAPNVVSPAVPDSEWVGLTQSYGVSLLYDQVPLAQDGPAEWPRVAPGIEPALTRLEPAGVHDVVVTPDEVRFSVNEIGRPVLVRVSAFPGWEVDGAAGPYRASPNFMVVVPIRNDVTVMRVRPALDSVAMLVGIIGLLLVLVLAFREARTSSRR